MLTLYNDLPEFVTGLKHHCISKSVHVAAKLSNLVKVTLKKNVIREYLNACDAWFISWGKRDSWIICVWSWKFRFPEVSPTDSKRDAWILLKFVRETGSRSPLCHPPFAYHHWLVLLYETKVHLARLSIFAWQVAFCGILSSTKCLNWKCRICSFSIFRVNKVTPASFK